MTEMESATLTLILNYRQHILIVSNINLFFVINKKNPSFMFMSVSLLSAISILYSGIIAQMDPDSVPVL